MKVAGLTGGIGSGKSYVAKIFHHLGVPVFYADEVGKRLLKDDGEVMEKVALHFPGAFTGGQIDRKKLASLAFPDPAKLEVLNGIIHPAVAREYDRWKQCQNASYGIKEAAILIETGSYKTLDALIVVTAPEGERIARVVKRDETSEADVRERMQRQLPENEKTALADFVIDNADGKMILAQVLTIHQRLSKG